MNILRALAHSKYLDLPALQPIKWIFDWPRLQLFNMPSKLRGEWLRRIDDVLQCEDRNFISPHPNAGKIVDGFLVMHNGIRIKPLSYYGFPMLRMFNLSKGVHEPQEERVFQEVLKVMPPGATMLELGSYWAFYSMWFQKAVPDAHSYMVEPEEAGLKSGKENFEINGLQGDFTRAFIGNEYKESSPPILTVDWILSQKNIPFLDLLHSDIQGYELQMLEGASNSFLQGKVGYVFISTHSNQVHGACENKLRDYGHVILHSINLDHSYSEDGLIVAARPASPSIPVFQLSRKSQNSK
jgi:hypothetical protein